VTYADILCARARAIRARLWRPPNAVHDPGFDLDGKDARSARQKIINQQIIEHIMLVEQLRQEKNKREI
jgi:hypothetical protein